MSIFVSSKECAMDPVDPISPDAPGNSGNPVVPASRHNTGEGCLGKEDLFEVIIKSMHEGLLLIDCRRRLNIINEAAVRILGLESVAAVQGTLIEETVGLVFNPTPAEYAQSSPWKQVLETGVPRFGVERRTLSGKNLQVNFVPVVKEGQVRGVLATIQDVTASKQLKESLIRANQELEEAFSLTLPNSKVTLKLKTTPEYVDVYDAATRTITITDIIEDGSYRHVINALKVLADLHKQGITEQIGIEKDTLVQAILFHDLGKVQPKAKIGDVVAPAQFFEDGRKHAERSAEFAAHYYRQPPDVVELIRYHHHREQELPDTFPFRLLPMLRLLQLVDGLSAGLTRRKNQMAFTVEGSAIVIREHSVHPQYNNIRRIDLFTGEVIVQSIS
ncbi:HD domain-containing protein [Heliobacillus mobilis]|uniref:HD domain-containing protein n=1 Tax=Heliobacterium mobile TaxID=28064 RepID=A0A6I3SHR6_HELMO|nr:HD domain-containing protein [Heliobacterium mobile]MTV48345.1 HD domain-containing protein [Heliobacterium mobile]